MILGIESRKGKRVFKLKEEIPMNNIASIATAKAVPHPEGFQDSKITGHLILAVPKSDMDMRKSAKAFLTQNWKLRLKSDAEKVWKVNAGD